MKSAEVEMNGRGEPLIIDQGNGPEFTDTRITVYDVLDYLLMAWEPPRIAALLRLTVEQVHAAVEYIMNHKRAVLTSYLAMLDREAQGNPPELQARLDACRGKARERAEELRKAKLQEDCHAGTAGGR